MSTKIAIVGHALSGKDVVADYLSQKYGFKHISTGSLLRKHIKEEGLGEPVRELQIEVANELRKTKGVSYFVDLALQLEKNFEQLVISGLRAIGEIDAFKKMNGIVIAVEAPIEERYKRAISRKRASDYISFEEFKQHEEVESHSHESHKQSIKYAIEQADYFVNNMGTIEDLYRKIDEIVREIQPKLVCEEIED